MTEGEDERSVLLSNTWPTAACRLRRSY